MQAPPCDVRFHIVWIGPDLVVEVRHNILQEVDGPMLRHGLQDLQGTKLLVLPSRRIQHQDPGSLAERYALFRSAGCALPASLAERVLAQNDRRRARCWRVVPVQYIGVKVAGWRRGRPPHKGWAGDSSPGDVL